MAGLNTLPMVWTPSTSGRTEHHGHPQSPVRGDAGSPGSGSWLAQGGSGLAPMAGREEGPRAPTAGMPHGAAAAGAPLATGIQVFWCVGSDEDRPTGGNGHGDRVRAGQLRSGVASCGSSSAGPSLGGSRSAERGCTGRAEWCSRPRRKFGFRRGRAPPVRRRRRGVCHCASAQPCLDCSPTQAGQTLLGLAIPRWFGLAVVASGRLPPAGSSSLVVLVAVVGLGWLGVARRARTLRG
jgi:hypothetical protein